MDTGQYFNFIFHSILYYGFGYDCKPPYGKEKTRETLCYYHLIIIHYVFAAVIANRVLFPFFVQLIGGYSLIIGRG